MHRQKILVRIESGANGSVSMNKCRGEITKEVVHKKMEAHRSVSVFGLGMSSREGDHETHHHADRFRLRKDEVGQSL